MTNIYGDMFTISVGMNRAVIASSIERQKEALVTKDPQFSGRPQDIYIARLISRGTQNIGYAHYEPYWSMLRKLTLCFENIYRKGVENSSNDCDWKWGAATYFKNLWWKSSWS